MPQISLENHHLAFERLSAHGNKDIQVGLSKSGEIVSRSLGDKHFMTIGDHPRKVSPANIHDHHTSLDAFRDALHSKVQHLLLSTPMKGGIQHVKAAQEDCAKFIDKEIEQAKAEGQHLDLKRWTNIHETLNDIVSSIGKNAPAKKPEPADEAKENELRSALKKTGANKAKTPRKARFAETVELIQGQETKEKLTHERLHDRLEEINAPAKKYVDVHHSVMLDKLHDIRRKKSELRFTEKGQLVYLDKSLHNAGFLRRLFRIPKKTYRLALSGDEVSPKEILSKQDSQRKLITAAATKLKGIKVKAGKLSDRISEKLDIVDEKLKKEDISPPDKRFLLQARQLLDRLKKKTFTYTTGATQDTRQDVEIKDLEVQLSKSYNSKQGIDADDLHDLELMISIKSRTLPKLAIDFAEQSENIFLHHSLAPEPEQAET